MISPSQSAFVKGRLLVENVLLATELVKGFGNKGISPRGALKVDISKAFDTVRWDFILATLEAAEFPPRFINWIRECITTTSFSISFNGELCGFFKGKRGLRQGDPLSPSLFLIAMEVFSNLLTSRFEAGKIKFHALCRNPKLTHLAFADDVLIFFNGRPDSLMEISSTFHDFYGISGLQLNMQKTTLYQTSLSTEELRISAELGYNIGQLPVRYLGLPLLSRRMRKQDYSPLTDAVSNRFSSWTVRHLSFSGRLQLISSVIYSVINFWMGAFLLPKGCLKEITRICTAFLWSGDMAKQAKAKVSWRKICLPKAEGGLGLRDLQTWNTVLMLRLIWIVFSKQDSLWVAWLRQHWLKRCNFWAARLSSSSSWVWRSLLSLRTVAQNFLTCKIGNGQFGSFWYDNWTNHGPLIMKLGSNAPRRVGLPSDITVSQACLCDTWRIPQGQPRGATSILLRSILLSMPLPRADAGPDIYLWGTSSSRASFFSNHKTWHSIRPKEATKSWASLIWGKSTIPKHSFTFWAAHLDRLPLRARLVQWGMSIPDTCCVCSLYPESRDHLFLHCHMAFQLWNWVGSKFGCPCVLPSWSSLLHWISSAISRRSRILRVLASQAVIYILWKERNARFHTSTSSTVTSLIIAVDRSVRDTLLARLRRKHHQNLLSLWFQYC